MKHLTRVQRYSISSLKKAGFSNRYISEDLGVSQSTISRELHLLVESTNFNNEVFICSIHFIVKGNQSTILRLDPK